MFCSISGVVPEQPVISVKSGHLFERSLVEKYVRETGKCPVTSESLSLDELLPLKANKTVKARPSPASSIPGLLGIFHDEWDALMLETHTLRQSLLTARQELSHALYMHDAATRVIARLIRERDEARSAMQNVRARLIAEQETAPAAKRGADENGQEASDKRQKVLSLPDAVIEEMDACNAQLSKARKKRAVSETLATPDELLQASILSSHPLHATTQGGIVALAAHPDQPSLLATGGLDSTVQIFNHSQSRVLASLEGHGKRVSAVAFGLGSSVVSTSADKTARIWSGGEGGAAFSCSAVLKEHQGEVTGCTMHPTRRFFATVSSDASYCFYDLERAECLQHVSNDEVGLSAVQFHPDGLLLGTGSEKALVQIWDLKQKKCVATLPSAHAKTIKALSFSENGYNLASASEEGVRIWDLRKLKNVHTLDPYEGSSSCNAVKFDHSGHYLAIGGQDLRVFNVKQDYVLVKSFEMPKKGAVHSVLFGPDARTILVGASDHNLRIVGVQSSNMQE